MFTTVLFVVMLVAVSESHPGEPQSWISTVTELLEKMIKTEMRVESMHQEVTAGLKEMANMKIIVDSRHNSCSDLTNKTGLYIFNLMLEYKFS